MYSPEIIIKNDLVVLVKAFTIRIKRNSDETFSCHNGVEDEGRWETGSLEEATGILHPDIAKKYVPLFNLKSATKKKILALEGFTDFEILQT